MAFGLGFGIGLTRQGAGIEPLVWVGAGTAESPYQVSSARHLNAVRDDLSAYYIQTANIGIADYNWTPIGTLITAPFTGNYDGDNYTITGLYFNLTGSDYRGLFGYTSSATIANVNITNANVYTIQYAGLLIGYDTLGTITNCHVSGSLTADSSLGGLIGATNYSTVTLCSADTTMYKRNCGGGGLIGVINYSTITKCHANVVFVALDTSEPWKADSFCGFAEACYHSTIENCYATGTAIGSQWGSGFIQNVDYLEIGEPATVITNCYAAVDVSPSIIPEPTVDQLPAGFIYAVGTEPIFETYMLVLTSSYFDQDVAGTTVTAAGTAKTTANMKKQATFVDWDFTTIWQIAEDTSYPTLR